jgi:hypothetical protein
MMSAVQTGLAIPIRRNPAKENPEMWRKCIFSNLQNKTVSQLGLKREKQVALASTLPAGSASDMKR